jgi:hypothetical protein
MAMGIEAEANEDLDVSLDRSAPPQESACATNP